MSDTSECVCVCICEGGQGRRGGRTTVSCMFVLEEVLSLHTMIFLLLFTLLGTTLLGLRLCLRLRLRLARLETQACKHLSSGKLHSVSEQNHISHIPQKLVCMLNTWKMHKDACSQRLSIHKRTYTRMHHTFLSSGFLSPPFLSAADFGPPPRRGMRIDLTGRIKESARHAAAAEHISRVTRARRRSCVCMHSQTCKHAQHKQKRQSVTSRRECQRDGMQSQRAVVRAMRFARWNGWWEQRERQTTWLAANAAEMVHRQREALSGQYRTFLGNVIAQKVLAEPAKARSEDTPQSAGHTRRRTEKR